MGSTLFVLLIAITVLSILGVSLSYIIQNRAVAGHKRGEEFVAEALADAGVHHALFRLRALFNQPLVTPAKPQPNEVQRVNEDLLNLLDADRARDWVRRFTLVDPALAKGGECHILMEVLNVSRVNLSTYIDRVEIIPRALEQYRERALEPSMGAAEGEQAEDTFGLVPLGGWVGKLRITASASYGNTRRVMEVIRDMKVVDITPPSPDHTLFIEGEGTEELKQGRFELSNLNLPLQVRDLVFDLTLKVNEKLRLKMSEDRNNALENVERIQQFFTKELSEEDQGQALTMIHELSKHASDESIKDMVDNIILSLDPRDWGRVRTNGVLYVHVPFWAADDIINYFADSSYFGHQRPEVGYLFCENRLHDPYLSVYTHYEGYIYKNYQRLNPLVLGPTDKPAPVPPQRYTINTRPDYVRRYPERKACPNLGRLEEDGRRHATRLVKKRTVLRGTVDNPLDIRGLVYCNEAVSVGGPFTGRGLIVCDKEITIVDDLERVNPTDSLALVALKQTVGLSPARKYYKVQAGIYSREGLRGTREQDLTVFGNLSVSTLNHPQMPQFFTCRFDSDLKNHMADNVVGVFSRTSVVARELGAETMPTPRRAGATAKELE